MGSIVHAAASVDASVSKAGSNLYHIVLQTDSKAPPAAVWTVLTDYDHHAQYLPYLVRSQVVDHNTGDKVVEQEGRFRILFWTFTVRVRQKVRETPPTGFHFQAVDGDFIQLEGDWHLSPAGQGTHVTSDFMVQPRRRVPLWAVKIAVSRYLAAMLKQMVVRAEKGGV
jgi:ribosome-associated toxin RatA of RatAB toxin-antitoxin module